VPAAEQAAHPMSGPRRRLAHQPRGASGRGLATGALPPPAPHAGPGARHGCM